MEPAKIKILIVESFQANIEMIVHEIDSELIHPQIEIADTQKDFKKKLLQYKPDLILSNNIFTSFDGMSLLLIKKKLAPQTPFIFVSFPAREEQMLEFFKQGLTEFVLKDNVRSLPSIIKRVLRDTKIHKRNEAFTKKEFSHIQEL